MERIIIQRLSDEGMISNSAKYDEKVLNTLEKYQYIKLVRSENKTIVLIQKGRNYVDAVAEYLK